MKEDNISQVGDYDAPFCEQQYTDGSFYNTLFKFKSSDQLIPPKLPQILDISAQLWHYGYEMFPSVFCCHLEYKIVLYYYLVCVCYQNIITTPNID